MAALLLASTAVAGDVLRPTWESGEYYGESFTFIADLDDGSYVHLTLGVTNMGPGSSHGVCRAVVVRPGRPRWEDHERTASDAWRYRPSARTAERLTVGPCGAWNGSASGIEVALGGGRVRLDFAEPLVPVEPPGALLHIGDAQYRSDLLAYRVPVKAVLALPGEAAVQLAGGGYADHSRSDVSPKDLARRWIRFRALRGDRGLLVLGRESREGRFEPVWCAQALPAFTVLPGFRLERSAAAGVPAFRAELEGDGLVLRSGALLFRDAPVESLGVLAPLVRPFVGNPVTYVYRAVATRPGGEELAGILEIQLGDE